MTYTEISRLQRYTAIQNKNINHLNNQLQIVTNEFVSTNNKLVNVEKKINSYKNIAKKSKQELASNNKKYLCSICFKNKKNIILNPCFHFNLCEECLKKIDKCPICRKEIECYHIVFH